MLLINSTTTGLVKIEKLTFGEEETFQVTSDGQQHEQTTTPIFLTRSKDFLLLITEKKKRGGGEAFRTTTKLCVTLVAHFKERYLVEHTYTDR